VGLLGGLLGLLVGHLLAGAGAVFFERTLGERIDWFKPDVWEWVYLSGVVAIAVLAGLVPGLKAYRTPVATNLVAA
jgi:ABC-type antimicrobial peptide transport system permease subunit